MSKENFANFSIWHSFVFFLCSCPGQLNRWPCQSVKMVSDIFFFSSLQSIAEQPKSWMISWHLSCWGCNRCACWCINKRNNTKWQKWSGTISIWDPFCRSLKQLNSSIKILSVAETARPKKIAFKKFHSPLIIKWQKIKKNIEHAKANSNNIFIYSVIIPPAYGEPIQPFPMDIIGD